MTETKGEYVLVPREPDEKMIHEGCDEGIHNDHDVSVIYGLMLAARPSHLDDLLKAMEECERALEPFAERAERMLSCSDDDEETVAGITLTKWFAAHHAYARLAAAKEKVKA